MNPQGNLAVILRSYPRLSAVSALNAKFGNGWMYCGWANKRLGLQTSPLANPFSCRPNARRSRIKVNSRNEAVERYRIWLWQQIQSDNDAVLDALISVESDTTLVCWCAPKRCHCEVISKAATWLKSIM